jgi:hypothetical protein
MRKVIWAVLLACFASRAYCSDTGKRLNQSEYGTFVNPHEYSLGQVESVSVVHPAAGKVWTALDWKPAYSPLLYEEHLLFCRDVSDKFTGVLTTDLLVLVFSRAVEVARVENPKGIIACRNLEQVVHIRTEEKQ